MPLISFFGLFWKHNYFSENDIIYVNVSFFTSVFFKLQINREKYISTFNVFPVVAANPVSTDRYSPHKRKLFGVLNPFKCLGGSEDPNSVLGEGCGERVAEARERSARFLASETPQCSPSQFSPL